MNNTQLNQETKTKWCNILNHETEKDFLKLLEEEIKTENFVLKKQNGIYYLPRVLHSIACYRWR